MWDKICSLILRKRLIILIILTLLTIVMGYFGSKVQMSYEFAKLLPDDDSTSIQYNEFKKTFGEDGSVFVIGIKRNDFFTPEIFNAWYAIGNKIKETEGVEDVLSVAHLFNLEKDESQKRFKIVPIVKNYCSTQNEVDSLKQLILSLPFYKEYLYNDSTGATLMAITLNKDILNSKAREKLIEGIVQDVEEIAKASNIEIYYSGMPFIRTQVSIKVSKEIKLFVFLSALVTAIILFLFFRSWAPVLVSMLVVAVGVLWSLGTVVLFGYKITILLGLIPPLIIVIGIPNCVYLINKYHQEYKKHGNQAKALTRIIQKIGGATFLTNMTTAIGFATFIFTSSSILIEFGYIAAVNVMIVFFLSLLIIPTVFSYLPPPKQKHIKHLDNTWMLGLVNGLINIVSHKRKHVYISTFIVIIISIYGISLIETTGNIADDVPRNDKLYTDLLFFEENFSGVMPFEVVIDTRKEGMAAQIPTLKKIEKLQELIHSYPEFSRPLSIAEVIKFSKQAYYNGNEEMYTLPSDMEKSFLAPYLTTKTEGGKDKILRSFMDSTKRYARVTAQMADIGTKEMQRINDDIRPKIDSIFNPEKYTVYLTGNSIVFLKGTNYLIKNLILSLALAIFIISILMSFLFMSFRMVFVSILPNFIPLIVTAGLMGYFGITIKPSTILVFSIAFGISVDDTIHYLAKYRQEIKLRRWDLKGSVLTALRESGMSMAYTSIILFFGFGIFSVSNFGGTVALGVLVSITLIVAMLSNLIILPSLLLSVEKQILVKAMNEPLLQILDEEEDMDINELVLPKKSENTV
ncbi:MAG: efflux RND transporter permease subunit [Bacteroidia bacterium]